MIRIVYSPTFTPFWLSIESCLTATPPLSLISWSWVEALLRGGLVSEEVLAPWLGLPTIMLADTEPDLHTRYQRPGFNCLLKLLMRQLDLDKEFPLFMALKVVNGIISIIATFLCSPFYILCY